MFERPRHTEGSAVKNDNATTTDLITTTPAAHAGPPTGSGPLDATALLDRLEHPTGYIRWTGTNWTTVHEPLTVGVLDDHLAGRVTVGTHPSVDGVARMGVIDIDLHRD